MITIEEFTEKFAAVFEDTDAAVFTPDCRFRELDEWDSYMALNVMAMVGDEYDVVLPVAEMKATQTVQEIYDLVCSKL